jgi:hypothetical protein
MKLPPDTGLEASTELTFWLLMQEEDSILVPSLGPTACASWPGLTMGVMVGAG